MKNKAALFGLVFFLFCANPVFSMTLKEIEKNMKEGRIKDSIGELISYIPSETKKEEGAARLYLLSWAYLLDKNYKEAHLYSRKLSKEYPNSKYYYPVLLLSAKISMDSGDLNGARKVLDWMLSHPNSIPDEFLLPAWVLKMSWIGSDSALFSYEVLNHGTFKLCLPEILQFSKKAKEKPADKKDFLGLQNFYRSKIGEIFMVPFTGRLIGRFEKQQDQPFETADMENKRKELIKREKELEIREMLLEEKKKLLYLKEEYLQKLEEESKNTGEKK